MTYYRINNDSANFLSFSLPQRKLIKHFRGKIPSKPLIGFCQKNETLGEFWSEVEADFVSVDGVTQSGAASPDIALWKQTALVFSEKVHNALAPDLADYGEFLPVCINGEAYFIFNCTMVVDVDEAVSRKVVEHEAVIDVLKVVFRPEDIQDKLVFKTLFDGARSIFCTDAFRKILEKNGFLGVNLKSESEDIFD